MIEARLRDILGPDVGIGLAPIGDPTGLFPEEKAAVAKAIAKRQAEFAAGRRAARAALRQIGAPEVAIPVGDKRAPVWPEGTLGAITHHDSFAIAVATRDVVSGIGIDVTDNAPLPEGTDRRIIPHVDEKKLTDIEARLAFAAKEAFFKAAFPSVHSYFDFSAVIFRNSENAFTLTQTQPLGPWPEGTPHRGHWFATDDDIIAAIVLP